MERQKGFLSTLTEEVVRGLSPARPSSSGHRRRRDDTTSLGLPDFYTPRSSTCRPTPETLSPLREGPDSDGSDSDAPTTDGWAQWLCRSPAISTAHSRPDLRLLLGVLGAPLAPVHVSNTDPFPHLCIKDTPIETSSAQYILQQYLAASGGHRRQTSIHNAYATGKLSMSSSDTTKPIKNRNSSKATELGGFVLWQMSPDKWFVELTVGGNKLRAGCNGSLVWRHTPWFGPHAAKGPVRPLRRSLQGLDPRTTANMFLTARCTGEKNLDGEDCFVLKLSADPQTLKARSEGPAEIIRHVLFGYFNQKTGLLVHLEDSHLTRIQVNGGEAVYWETTINSDLDDYRAFEGVAIAHSGRSVATLIRFGETETIHSKTRMEELWTIEEVAFNVPGLSVECFIPPSELRFGSKSDGA